MKLVFISDTHGKHDELDIPQGDVLVHCGDMTGRDSVAEVSRFSHWFRSQPHRHKVIIAGNHDWLFQREPSLAKSLLTSGDDQCHYLQDSEVTIEGVKFYGSPWQPEFYNWAFNLPRGTLHEKWDLIPEDTDVLITHGPPHGILDQNIQGIHCGCEELLEAVNRINPKVCAFGHIHEAFGVDTHSGVQFVNASNLDFRYRVVNPPVVIEVK